MLEHHPSLLLLGFVFLLYEMLDELILVVFHYFLKVLGAFVFELFALLDDMIQYFCLFLSAFLINIEWSGNSILHSAYMLRQEILKLTILVSLVHLRLQTNVHSTCLGYVDSLAP